MFQQTFEQTEDHIILCQCGVTEHLVHIQLDKDWGVQVNTYLQKAGLFTRLKRGIKYILGIIPRYGEFGESILDPKDYDELITLFQKARTIERTRNEEWTVNS